LLKILVIERKEERKKKKRTAEEEENLYQSWIAFASLPVSCHPSPASPLFQLLRRLQLQAVLAAYSVPV